MTRARRVQKTPDRSVVGLARSLTNTLRPSPVVGLNRAIANGQRGGPGRGLEEIHAIADHDRLASYPFYHAALGEFEFRSGRHQIAREQFRAALTFTRNPAERQFFEHGIAACEPTTPRHVL